MQLIAEDKSMLYLEKLDFVTWWLQSLAEIKGVSHLEI